MIGKEYVTKRQNDTSSTKDGRKRTFLEQATAETNPIRMRGSMVRNEHLSELVLEWSNSQGTHDNEKNIFKQSVVGVGKSRIISEH